jgi:acyl-CoA thioesterase-2
MPQLPPRLKEYFQMRINDPVPFEFKPISNKFKDLFKPEKDNAAKQYVWLRASGKLPDGLQFHHLAAAYASDHFLLSSALLPHGITYLSKPVRITMMASLDHMLWFHRYCIIANHVDHFVPMNGCFLRWRAQHRDQEEA